jgi:hypothetical protein
MLKIGYKSVIFVLSVLLLQTAIHPAIHSLQARQQAMNMWHILTMDRDAFRASGMRPVKCATWVYAIIRDDWDALDIRFQQKFLKKEAARAARLADLDQTYTRSIFTIHYTRTGIDAVPSLDTAGLIQSGFVPGADGVPDYVQFVAAACDSTYNFVVNGLGYNYPVSRVGVSMLDLADYGGAYSTDSIVIENDMDFPVKFTKDDHDAFNVTIAHEFFHMVQFGYKDWPYNFFHEPSAVWMEDKVYPEVNDYLQYLDQDSINLERNIFSYPQEPFDNFNDYYPGNYDKVVWPMFLDQRYHADVIKYAWAEYSSNQSPESRTKTIEVFDQALKAYNSGLTFSGAFSEFGKWIFLTGSRNSLGPSFEDAAIWPEVKLDALGYDAFIDSRKDTLKGLSLNYTILSGRAGYEIALRTFEASPMGYYFALLESSPLPTLVHDTLLTTSDPFINISWWAGRAGHNDFFGLFNPGAGLRTFEYIHFDSLYVLQAGDSIMKQKMPGLHTFIRMQDSMIFTFKDTLGNLDTTGKYRFNLVHALGIRSDTLQRNSKVFFSKDMHLKHLVRVYRVAVLQAFESFIDEGKLTLAFRIEDSSRYYLNYAVDVVDSVARKVLLHVQKDDSLYSFDYNLIKASLKKRRVIIGTDSVLARTFHICIAGIDTVFDEIAFPNPVYTDDPSFNIVYDAQEKEIKCFIYTLSGQLIKTLSSRDPSVNVSGQNAEGQRVFTWDVKNRGGKRVAPGIYLYYVKRADAYLPRRGKIAIIGNKRN